MTVAITILALVATVLAVTALANRIRFSAPLLLMLVGIGLSFLPRVPIPELSAELGVDRLLPPLLYAAAIRTSVIDFRANRRSIAQLSVLLVVVTALGVGLITWLILPVSFRWHLPWALWWRHPMPSPPPRSPVESGSPAAWSPSWRASRW